MGEASGSDEQKLQDYLLRELISEGRLRYLVAQPGEGRRMVTQTVEKNGPVVFIVTTTKAALHAENETRMLSLEVDDSERQTKAVLDKVAEIVGLNAEQSQIDYEPWKDFQRWLAVGNRNVVVPFAEHLVRLMPPRSVRLRRDISQVLLAIKAHALLHRQHRQIDEREQIVADIWDDYAPVAELMGGIVAEASGAAIRKELAQTIEAVEIATAGMGEDEGVTADKIGKRLRLDKSSAWRRLNNAAFAGFVVNLETRKGQPGRYRLTDQEFEPEELLPSPEALADAFSGAAQPVQPRNLTHNRQVFEELGDCATGCTVAPIAYPPEQVDAFEERAAILEYDGGSPELKPRRKPPETMWMRQPRRCTTA